MTHSGISASRRDPHVQLLLFWCAVTGALYCVDSGRRQEPLIRVHFNQEIVVVRVPPVDHTPAMAMRRYTVPRSASPRRL